MDAPADHVRRARAGLPRLERPAAVATVAALFAAAAALLRCASQAGVLAILACTVAAFVLADRTGPGRWAAAACRRRAGSANAAAAAGALALVVLFREDDFALLMMATVASYATASLGLNLQTAFAGLPNFAGAAFFAVGSYAAAVLSALPAVPWPLAVASGGLAAAAVGSLLILPVLRARGHYAALATIAFGLLLRTWLEANDALGGPQGMKVAGAALFGVDFNGVSQVGPFPVSSYLPYAIAATLLFAASLVVVGRLERSWAGVALDAVRTDEVAASTFGLSVARWRSVAFTLGNAIIGAAGALYATMEGYATPSGADIGQSLLLLSIVVLGGLGNLWGGLVAAAVVVVLPEKLQAIQEYRLLIFSLLVVAILRFRPAGLLPRRLRDLPAGATRAGAP